MRSDSENLLRTLIQTLVGGRVEAGDLAWLLLGVLMFAGIVGLVILYAWILRGGLSRQRFFSLSPIIPEASNLKED